MNIDYHTKGLIDSVVSSLEQEENEKRKARNKRKAMKRKLKKDNKKR